jgi:heterodisulfide reductase subunit A
MTAVTDIGEIKCSAVIVVSDLEASSPERGSMPLSVLSESEPPKGTAVLDLRGGPNRRGRVQALRAMKKMLDDGGRVLVLVDEVLAYGRDELLYLHAQQAGALFIRPRVVEWDGERMEVIDDMTGAIISVMPDAFISESATSEHLADRGTVSMGPLTTNRRGVLRVRANLLDDELATEARAAATIALHPTTELACPAEVDEERCSACLTCVRICPFGAAYMNADGKASIDGDLCHSCGKCAAACAGKAITIPGSADQELEARIAAAMEGR